MGNEFGNDVVGSKRVGMRAVWKTSSPSRRPEYVELPDAVIPSLVELPLVLGSWLQGRMT